tara:strand:- start:133 stop:237 length:105 start_codon:yes stop_codon:yes gene_type:complete
MAIERKKPSKGWLDIWFSFILLTPLPEKSLGGLI